MALYMYFFAQCCAPVRSRARVCVCVWYARACIRASMRFTSLLLLFHNTTKMFIVVVINCLCKFLALNSNCDNLRYLPA